MKNKSYIKSVLTCAMFISVYNVFSQTDLEQYRKDSAEIMKVKLISPQFRVDNKTVFIGGQGINMSGTDVGFLLKEKLRVTVGYMALTTDIRSQSITIEDTEYKRTLQYNCGNLNTEFIYKNTRFFSLGMPLDFGFGYNELKYVNTANEDVLSKKSGFVSTIDFGLSLTFKPIRWVGLKTLLGYRKMVFNEVKDFNFDGITSSIGINLDVKEIARDIKMFRLKKKYHIGNRVENAVDLITD